jgi:cellulose synthase/poly-beta-1,6-N-acetylglucosamine synthase-like glycosyltransferase
MMLALEVALWISVGLWALSALWTSLNWLLVTGLPEGEARAVLPALSVVIPARDERRWIGEAIASHCSQEYQGLQVVVVDDGSTDGTREILHGLQERFSNLVVIQGTEPSEGWLGKTNALRQGLEKASGEFVLLADADVRYAQGTHRRAVEEMLRRDLDMLVLLPHHEGPWGAQLVIMQLDAIFLFGVPSFLYNASWLKGWALGAGAGNVIRREALQKAGGIEAVKGEVIDDIALGRRVKALRGRLRVVKAFEEVRVQMYGSFKEAFDGFTKNLHAFLGSGLWGVALGTGGLFYHLMPLGTLAFAALLPRRVLLLAALATAIELSAETATCIWSRHRIWLAPLFPVRIVLWSALSIRSAWRYHSKGLVWRGRVYKKDAF